MAMYSAEKEVISLSQLQQMNRLYGHLLQDGLSVLVSWLHFLDEVAPELGSS